jgi:hypothetical protein
MNDHNKRGGIGGWLAELAAWPTAAVHYAAGKWGGLMASRRMARRAVPLALAQTAVKELMACWQRMEPFAPIGAGNGVNIEASGPLGAMTDIETGADHPESLPQSLCDEERSIVKRIREETERLNRNNVTRTEAYRAAYFRSPGLHWAMLAHMVSRNGGWNMTDLKGELLPRLLGPEQREPVYRFLERANALIFRDAFPQLLLYENGLRLGRDLSHLLPAFGVSRFMRPVWEQFWRTRDAVPLTIALIVNEQHYIEMRVVREPYFHKKVVGTLFFGIQSLMQLNQVVFPYRLNKSVPNGHGVHHAEELRLAGLIMESFSDLRGRIEFGKKLYALLFGIPELMEGTQQFARTVRHTGSRADYAPHLFAPVRRGLAQQPYRERLEGGRLRPGAEPFYSPSLADAWSDTPVQPPEPGDWFGSAREITTYFSGLSLPLSFEMTNEYRFGLSKLELAVVTAQQLSAGLKL